MTTAPIPSSGRIAVLPVDSAAVTIPAWSPLGVGDTDTFWFDLSLWSTARGGEIPGSGPITASVSPPGLMPFNLSFVTGTPFQVGAIQCTLSGGSVGTKYLVTFSFLTTDGDMVNRSVSVQVVQR